MPVVQPGSKILVTSGNGYIGVSAIRSLLERGYAVLATVKRKERRRQAEVDWLSELFKGIRIGLRLWSWRTLQR
jgi:NAD(P)-dependent dehydrogenase (short-subunit alcohol dehydrogenase family)